MNTVANEVCEIAYNVFGEYVYSSGVQISTLASFMVVIYITLKTGLPPTTLHSITTMHNE
jgi:hypothetical protein